MTLASTPDASVTPIASATSSTSCGTSSTALETSLTSIQVPSSTAGTMYMNVKPGGKQRVMHDTRWCGMEQKMVFSDGTPKGMKAVLQERGIDTTGLVADKMREILKKHSDFRDEKYGVPIVSKCLVLVYSSLQ